MSASRGGNPLLAKPELGRSIKHFYTLPSDDFTYGMRSSSKDGGAAEAIGSWSQIPNLPQLGQEPKMPRDFISLNKAAVKKGLTTSQEQFQFRAMHDVRQRPRASGRVARTKSMPSTDITFGTTTRPSTPIYDLLEHKYQAEWIEQQRQKDRALQKSAKEERAKSGRIYETRATVLRKFAEPVKSSPPWRMPRFTKIPAKLQTFRTPAEREKAMKYHSSDAVSRKGIFGQGVYASATC
ncbi:cilia- and flagella-associated protein 77-like [Oscarella lobularis]|uniref:cilia- and flagella-associated protein 77-like n=1 Tax=Oscarella lobularis TaxID=121494 RepID=UPI003314146D